MSRRNTFTSTCPTGKAQFTSEAAAKRGMRSKGARLRAYLCPQCQRWHLTNPGKQ